ncbi:MAG TPA: serine hydrolase [Pyrinomonadaceae bacterium]|nr:serine hydrolase [Pyrinomonadaceae bacterium]
MIRLFLSVLLAAGLQTIVSARPAADKVEALLRREMRERRIPGLQVAVVRRGKIVLLRSLGTADVQHGVPVGDNSIFAINSCTKAFTGVAVMQLVEDGKLDLSAPVSDYLDGLPASWRPVTVRQLLTHVSGLPNILAILDPSTGKLVGRDNEDAAWAKVLAMPPEFPSGERFGYNQTNYVLLGKLIDKYGGEPFARFFGARQFQPAGMTHTIFGDSRDVIPNYAPSYRYVRSLDGHPLAEDKLTLSYAEFPPFRRTASGLNSTAEDVARWLIALQGGRLLKTKAALRTLWAPGSYNDGRPTQWALGWMTKPRPRHSAVIATGGSRAAFFVYPEDELAVVVLTNLAGAFPEEFIDELAGVYVPAIPESDPVTALRVRLRARGFEHAAAVYGELRKKDPAFRPAETDLNDWAYRMMNGGGKKKEALEIFKLNVLLYPESANVYDSVAEAYEANGERALAVKNYRRSLDLDPGNKNAARHLRRLDPTYK